MLYDKTNLTTQQITTNQTIEYLEKLTFANATVTQAVKSVFASFPVNYSFNVGEKFRIYVENKLALGYLSIVQKSKTSADNNQRQAELTCRQEGNTFNVGLEFGGVYSISDRFQAKFGVSWSAYGTLPSINELTITKDGKADTSHGLLANLVERKAASLSSPSINVSLFGMQELSLYLAMSLAL